MPTMCWVSCDWLVRTCLYISSQFPFSTLPNCGSWKLATVGVCTPWKLTILHFGALFLVSPRQCIRTPLCLPTVNTQLQLFIYDGDGPQSFQNTQSSELARLDLNMDGYKDSCTWIQLACPGWLAGIAEGNLINIFSHHKEDRKRVCGLVSTDLRKLTQVQALFPHEWVAWNIREDSDGSNLTHVSEEDRVSVSTLIWC